MRLSELNPIALLSTLPAVVMGSLTVQLLLSASLPH